LKKKDGRDGTKNLKPTNTLTMEERKELARKGGKASVIARRKKADLKKTMQVLLSLDVTDKKQRKQLEDLGLETTNEALLALTTFQQAVKGNQRATENVIKLATTEKDKHDIAEQKERIKAMKMKNKRELEAGGLENGEIIIFNDIPSE
jgi:hypothetical protein